MPEVLGPNDPDVRNLAAKMAQQDMQRQYVETFIRTTAQMIFSDLVSSATRQNGRLSPDVLRQAAQAARDFAPFLAEGYGMVNIESAQTENVGDVAEE